MEPAISIRNLRKSFNAKTILADISFDIGKGKTVAVIGSSGSGKTTLLRCLNGLINPDEGEIHIAGFTVTRNLIDDDARRLQKNVGMVFQQFNLWPHRTVLQNVMDAPVLVKKMKKKDAEERARILLARVGMESFASEYASSLSGGQQQRVAIARALAMEPEVLLLDEITSSLDPELTSEVLKVIRDVAHEHARTMVIVTHEMEFARNIADEILFMDNGEIVERGTPSDILDHPKENRTRKFLIKIAQSE